MEASKGWYGDVLRECRQRTGLSQEALAELMHVSRGVISKIETNRQVLTIPTLLKWIELTHSREVMVAIICGMDAVTIMQQVMGMMLAFWLM